MTVQTYTSTGNKSNVAVRLNKNVFGLEVKNHELLKQAYVAYLSNKRQNLAKAKKRGEVSGGGRKPWRQKGTGRARFGSSRNPIWRGGGVAFGPTGLENYNKDINSQAKRQAIRQALSTANSSGKISVIEALDCKSGKVKPVAKFMEKIEATGNALIVVSHKDDLVLRATGNLPGVKVVQANYVNVYDVLNADVVVFEKKALDIIQERLDPKAANKNLASPDTKS